MGSIRAMVVLASTVIGHDVYKDWLYKSIILY